MARITYTHRADGHEVLGMFDSETAERFESLGPEDIERGPLPEELFLTDDGFWIVNKIQSAGGGADRSVYETVPGDLARQWLLDNDYPEVAKRQFDRERGGRPAIGEKIELRVPFRMVGEIDAAAEDLGVDRPEAMRRLLSAALAARRFVTSRR